MSVGIINKSCYVAIIDFMNIRQKPEVEIQAFRVVSCSSEFRLGLFVNITIAPKSV